MFSATFIFDKKQFDDERIPHTTRSAERRSAE
jgi:hypothetical protein